MVKQRTRPATPPSRNQEEGSSVDTEHEGTTGEGRADDPAPSRGSRGRSSSPAPRPPARRSASERQARRWARARRRRRRSGSAQQPRPSRSRSSSCTKGKIHTMDGSNRVVEEILIKNGRFVEVGDHVDRSATTKVVNLKGRTVVPGIIDNHNHIILMGNRPGYHTPLENAYSVADVQQTFATRAAGIPAGGWITTIGGFHSNHFAELRLPTPPELDAAVPDEPGVHPRRASRDRRRRTASARRSSRRTASRSPTTARSRPGRPAGDPRDARCSARRS